VKLNHLKIFQVNVKTKVGNLNMGKFKSMLLQLQAGKSTDYKNNLLPSPLKNKNLPNYINSNLSNYKNQNLSNSIDINL